MFSMFVLNYGNGKHKTIDLAKPEIDKSERKYFTKVAGSVMSLCGKNRWCQVTNVVLRSIDDLSGGHHSGSTSNVMSHKGTIRRDFEKHTYRIAERSANVEAVVCLDHTQCD